MAPTRSKILVTGGAGYIGSHVVLQLLEAGYAVVVYDSLVAGHRWAAAGADLVVGDLADTDRLSGLFKTHEISAVMHFAAHIVVPESVEDPLKYYGNNTRNTLGLLEICARSKIGQFIFSSTAAVYGTPEIMPITEDAPLRPQSPYGASKMMSERLLIDLAEASDLRFSILRYFNVAGADPSGRIGEAHEPETHLIPLVAQTALGQRTSITIHGTDYATADGTCIRDYVHVCDLARAHVDALRYLEEGNESVILNCGYGHGYSVREIIDAAKAVSGVDFRVEFGDRRPGDPPELVAANKRISEVLGWTPRYDDLEHIIGSAIAWERTLRTPDGQPKRPQRSDAGRPRLRRNAAAGRARPER